MARATGKLPEQLREPPIAAPMQPLAAIFNELAAVRANNGFGPQPLAPSEIHAWARGVGVRFSPWEFETLLAADRAGLAVLNAASDGATTEKARNP